MPEVSAPCANGHIRVVLADDHSLVRSGLRLLLDSVPDITVVAESCDLEGAVSSSLCHQPQVLILDLHMPGSVDAAGVIPQVQRGAPDTKVVVLTMDEDPVAAQAVLQAGALGYALKEAPPEELIEAVRRVAAGETYLNRRVRTALNALTTQDHADRLTPRETQVLRLAALGHTNREIAAQLLLSLRTVESHRARIRRKLGTASRAALVRYARARGLLN